MAFSRVLLVANPIAGRGRGAECLATLGKELEARGCAVLAFATAAAGDATAVASAAIEAAAPLPESPLPKDPLPEDPPHLSDALRAACAEARAFAPDLILSIGGDGTLREVLDGVARAPLPVGMLPMGTANVLALDFRLPRTPAALADLVLRGTTRQLDLAEVTGTDAHTGEAVTRTSFLAIGLGLDAEVVRRVDAARSGAITKWSYVPQAARAVFAHRELELNVEVRDGDAWRPLTNERGDPLQRCAALLAANVVNFGGILKLDRATRSDDGLWELYFWERARIPHLAVSFLRGLVGRIVGAGCQLRRVREVRITSARPVFYHVDGDPGGYLPLTLRVTDRRQAILAP